MVTMATVDILKMLKPKCTSTYHKDVKFHNNWTKQIFLHGKK